MSSQTATSAPTDRAAASSAIPGTVIAARSGSGLRCTVTSPGNLAPSDVFLARALYDRSSKAHHGESGWKATPTEALLLLSGVAAILERMQSSR